MKDNHDPHNRFAEDGDPHEEARQLQAQSRPGHQLQWPQPLEEKVGAKPARKEVSGVSDEKERGALNPTRTCIKRQSEHTEVAVV